MKKINQTFICINCKQRVQPAQKTCRNHCPLCFTSLHVDEVTPWDRKSTCWGVMKPITYEIKNGQTKILFKCTKCGKSHRNKTAQDDDINELIKKTTIEWQRLN